MMARLLCGGLVLLLAGCAPQGQVEVVLDKPDPRRLLRFYFGSYTAGGADPFSAGILHERGQRFYVDPAALDGQHPGMGAALLRRTRGNVLGWDSLGAFLDATYYQARQLPPDMEAFKARWPYRGWMPVDVEGPMTRARRRIFVSESALRGALAGYQSAGRRLHYAEGTAIVADHYLDGTLIEHTAMVRRMDGFWDFATYGPDGRLAAATAALPRALKTPLQCVGCHFGTKLFEPERSFPQPAPPAPEGRRLYHVADAVRNEAVVRHFEEHARRSDTVLGLYGTLYAAKLLAGRDTLTSADRALLAGLGL